ncbi:helix-turn-helix domain-containing protein [Oscillospiraceae bacterium PP1C4]
MKNKHLHKISFSYSTVTWMWHIAILVSTLFIITMILIKSYERTTINLATSLNNDFSLYTDTISSQIQTSIRHHGMQTFYSPAVTKLRSSGNELTNFEQISGIREMVACVSSNNLIHSVYVYNGQQQYVYTTNEEGSFSIGEFADASAVKYFTQQTADTRLRPIPRRITRQSGEQGEDVYSFLIYDSGDGVHFKNALMINVFFEEYNNNFFYSGKMENEEMLLLDKNAQLLAASPSYNSDFISTDLNLLTPIIVKQLPDGYIINKARREKAVYMYSFMPMSEWYFVRILPYQSFMSGLHRVQQHSFIIVLLVAIAGTLLFMVSMKRFYRPLKKAVRSLMPHDLNQSNASDDIMLNLDLWVQSRDNEKENYLTLLKEEFLKQLLTSPVPQWKNVAQNFRKYGINISTAAPIYLLIFREVAVESAINALRETYPSLLVDGVVIESNTVLLLQPDKSVSVAAICEKIIALGAGFCGYSQPIVDLSDLQRVHTRMCEVTLLRIFYPDRIILSESILNERRKENIYLDRQEAKLLCALKAGRQDEILEVYNDFIKITRNYRYNVIIFNFKRLYLAVRSLCQQLEGDNSSIEVPDIDYIEHLFSTAEDFDEVHRMFYAIFDRISQYVLHARDEKNQAIVQQLKGLIHQQYTHFNLSPSFLAEQLGIPLVQLGKIFRAVEKVSISDYINAIRIEKAKDLLMDDHGFTVKEITSMVGIENNQYFYTLFKKNTGLTPASYRQLRDYEFLQTEGHT